MSAFQSLSELTLENWGALLGIIATVATAVGWVCHRYLPRRSAVPNLKITPSLSNYVLENGTVRSTSIKIEVLNDEDIEVGIAEVGLRNRSGSKSLAFTQTQGVPFRMSGRKTHRIVAEPRGIGGAPDFSGLTHVYVKTDCRHQIKKAFKNEIVQFAATHRKMSEVDAAEHAARNLDLRSNWQPVGRVG